MPYLFDTDAISELLRPKPAPAYVQWIARIPREDQFVSAISIGELYQGAFRSPARDHHIENIEAKVLPAVTVLPFDVEVSKVFGRIRAELEAVGMPLPDADLQIAATAIRHELELVTGNVRHFRRIAGLVINVALAEAKRDLL